MLLLDELAEFTRPALQIRPQGDPVSEQAQTRAASVRIRPCAYARSMRGELSKLVARRLKGPKILLGSSVPIWFPLAASMIIPSTM
jgi:hypothetical protein